MNKDWDWFLVTKSDLIHDSVNYRFYDEGDQPGHTFRIEPHLMFDFWNIAIWEMMK